MADHPVATSSETVSTTSDAHIAHADSSILELIQFISEDLQQLQGRMSHFGDELFILCVNGAGSNLCTASAQAHQYIWSMQQAMTIFEGMQRSLGTILLRANLSERIAGHADPNVNQLVRRRMELLARDVADFAFRMRGFEERLQSCNAPNNVCENHECMLQRHADTQVLVVSILEDVNYLRNRVSPTATVAEA